MDQFATAVLPKQKHFDAAMEILRKQSHVPASVGARIGEQPLMCAGAALIAAALEVEFSKKARDAFAIRITAPGGKRHCLKMINDLKWPWIRDIMKQNDKCDPSIRKEYMISVLGNLFGEIGVQQVRSEN